MPPRPETGKTIFPPVFHHPSGGHSRRRGALRGQEIHWLDEQVLAACERGSSQFVALGGQRGHGKAFCVFSDSGSGAPWIPSRMVRILVSSETDCASNCGPNGVAAYTIPARTDTGCFVASSSLSPELSRNAALGLDTIAYLH